MPAPRVRSIVPTAASTVVLLVPMPGRLAGTLAYNLLIEAMQQVGEAQLEAAGVSGRAPTG
jgi:hypothetical protein